MSVPTIRETESTTSIIGSNYEMTIVPERMMAILRGDNDFYYGMCLISAIDALSEKDKTLTKPEVSVAECPERNGVVVEIARDSNIWKKVIHRYLLKSDSLVYETEIQGEGSIGRAHFFRGVFQETELASAPGFDRVFSPQANFIEKQEFHVNEFQSIGVGNYKDVQDSVWGFALHGAPLCYVCHNSGNAPYMSVGILAKPGEYMFHAFEMNYLSESDKRDIPDSIVGTEAFSLPYDGHINVSGTWKSPKLLMRFACDKTSALKTYLSDLSEYGGAPKRALPYESWTFNPVFCTWHEQVALGIDEKLSPNKSFDETENSDVFFNHLTEANCRRWLATLREHDIEPGTIILDAKWQKNVGDPIADTKKFPDLRGFIDECHAKGQKVVLWHNGWDREGVPDDECCMLDGKPVAVDPSNPKYKARVREYARRLFGDGEGCYDADGLKVDGMTATPMGSTLKTFNSLYGFELARALLALLYDEAKAVKKECAIGQFTACPYFADKCDFARTGDLYTVRGDPNATNAFRAEMQRIVMPAVPIDTDGALRFNYAAPDDSVLAKQNELGVPCLYQAETLVQRRNFCMEIVEKISESQYESIAKAWDAYKDNRK